MRLKKKYLRFELLQSFSSTSTDSKTHWRQIRDESEGSAEGATRWSPILPAHLYSFLRHLDIRNYWFVNAPIVNSFNIQIHANICIFYIYGQAQIFLSWAPSNRINLWGYKPTPQCPQCGQNHFWGDQLYAGSTGVLGWTQRCFSTLKYHHHLHHHLPFLLSAQNVPGFVLFTGFIFPQKSQKPVARISVKFLNWFGQGCTGWKW